MLVKYRSLKNISLKFLYCQVRKFLPSTSYLSRWEENAESFKSVLERAMFADGFRSFNMFTGISCSWFRTALNKSTWNEPVIKQLNTNTFNIVILYLPHTLYHDLPFSGVCKVIWSYQNFNNNLVVCWTTSFNYTRMNMGVVLSREIMCGTVVLLNFQRQTSAYHNFDCIFHVFFYLSHWPDMWRTQELYFISSITSVSSFRFC